MFNFQIIYKDSQARSGSLFPTIDPIYSWHYHHMSKHNESPFICRQFLKSDVGSGNFSTTTHQDKHINQQRYTYQNSTGKKGQNFSKHS